MLHILKLIRLPNLLVVVLTQVLVFYHLIRPALLRFDLEVQLTDWQFWLIVLACVLVTAGGYIINDILDAAGDAVNRPGSNPVYQIGIGVCRYLYVCCILLGYGCCFFLAFATGQQALLWLYPLICGALALYSRYIKTLPLVGNLLVATLCAGVPGIIAIAERRGLSQLWDLEPLTVRLLFIYGCFAFLTTLLRELVKDLEDIKGDLVLKRRTLPIVLGQRTSLMLATALVLVNLLAIASPYVWSWPGFQSWPVILLLCLLGAGLLTMGVLLLRARMPAHYGRVSSGMKLLMLLGLLLLFIVKM